MTKKSLKFIILLTSGLALTVLAGVAWTIYGLREQVVSDAMREADNLTGIIEHQLGTSIRTIDIILEEIVLYAGHISDEFDEGYGDQISSRQTQDYLRGRKIRLREADSITITDAEGNSIASSRSFPAPLLRVADRAFFMHLKAHRTWSLYVNDVITSRITNQKIIVFARRIEHKSGKFLGVAFIAVRLDELFSAYDGVLSAPGQRLTLWRLDAENLRSIATRISEDAAPSSGESVQSGASVVEAERIFKPKAGALTAFRKIGSYPLAVTLCVSRKVILKRWSDLAVRFLIGAGILIAIFAALLQMLLRQFIRLSQSEAEIRASRNELKTLHLRVDTAIANMKQGFCMFDGGQRLVLSNSRYASMFGIDPAKIKPGIAFEDILRLRVKSGFYSGDDPEAYMRERVDLVQHQIAGENLSVLRNGKVYSHKRSPMGDGGWVSVVDDVTEQQKMQSAIAHMARYDALTSLANRTTLAERLDGALSILGEREKLALLYVDLDGFKAINDTLGHSSGDRLLRTIAERLKSIAGSHTLVSRIGGDEFALLLTGLQSKSEASVLARRIIEETSREVSLETYRIAVGASVGIAIAPDDASDRGNLIRAADLAMYQAKKTRGCFAFYEPRLSQTAQRRSELVRDLRSALSRTEFEIVYQPILDCKKGTIGSIEALLRWNHPRKGVVMPSDFVPLAEEAGLMEQIGEWIISKALADAAKWPASHRLSINVSGGQLKGGQFAKFALAAVSDSGFSPARVQFEVTESVFLEEDASVLATLKELNAAGFRLVLDDFGTGYSSLHYLLKFPFSKIKVDRGFIGELKAESGQSFIILRAIASLAKSLGVATTGEGVETQLQLDILKKEGFDEAQGDLITPPLSQNDLARFLETSSNRFMTAA